MPLVDDVDDDVRAAFSLFHDELSRREFVAQIKWLMSVTGGVDKLPAAARDRTKEEEQLFRLGAREVYVDCGAYDGDTIRDFLSRQRDAFERIVAFEPDPRNYLKLQAQVDALPDHLWATLGENGTQEDEYMLGAGI